MTEDQDTERPGIGKVVYSVDDTKEKRKKSIDRPREDGDRNCEVLEADEESFPASDPPGYAGGHAKESR
jgi:hypothetical protein